MNKMVYLFLSVLSLFFLVECTNPASDTEIINPLSFTVTFDSEYATVEANPASKSVIVPDTTIDVLPLPPTKTGYTFAGWYTEINGGGEPFTASTLVSGNITVFASWSTNPVYLVTFNSDGGTTVDARLVTLPETTLVTLPPAPVKTGYTFNGWYMEINGAGLVFTADTPVSLNCTVFADWTADIYTVIFDSQGSTLPSNPASKSVIVPDTTIDVLPLAPTKTGYTFAGWYTEINGGGEPFTASTLVSGDITIYACWLANIYTVTFNNQGATIASNPLYKSVVVPATTIDVLPSYPIKTGYTFAGWYTAINGQGSEFTATSIISNNVTVYANWIANTYTVTFDSQGATTVADPISKSVVFPGTTIDSLPIDPVKTGYVFAGWYTEANGNGSRFVQSTIVSANITLYATWSKWKLSNLPHDIAHNPSTWNSIAYGNGTFVAIADNFMYGGNAVATSTDGIVWTNRILPSLAYWQSVTYGDGRFVVIAGGYYGSNKVATSTDGITWTVGTMSETKSWYSVTYGNGMYVAVAKNSSTMATSLDGITWTARNTMPVFSFFDSVVYGNNIFVAVANTVSSGGIAGATSSDGITWTARTLPSTNGWWSSITFGNGLFVAVDAWNNAVSVATSPDGIIWTARNLPSAQWTGVVFGSDLYVAVARSSNDNVIRLAATSIDGLNWTAEPMPIISYWCSIAYGNNLFVAIAPDGKVAVLSK